MICNLLFLIFNEFAKLTVRWLFLFGQFTMNLINRTALSNIAPNEVM